MIVLLAFVLVVIGVPLGIEYFLRPADNTLKQERREIEIVRAEVAQRVHNTLLEFVKYLVSLANQLALELQHVDPVITVRSPVSIALTRLAYWGLRFLVWLITKIFSLPRQTPIKR